MVVENRIDVVEPIRSRYRNVVVIPPGNDEQDGQSQERDCSDEQLLVSGNSRGSPDGEQPRSDADGTSTGTSLTVDGIL